MDTTESNYSCISKRKILLVRLLCGGKAAPAPNECTKYYQATSSIKVLKMRNWAQKKPSSFSIVA
jgi:hypothetical protein